MTQSYFLEVTTVKSLSSSSPGIFRSNHPELFLGKGVLKICSKFTGEQTRRSVISIKLQSNANAGKCGPE